MLEEMQSLEEDKNRAIEEAFARAQVEMKAVHENLAGEPAGWALACPTPKPLALPASHLSCPPTGVRTNLLTLQPALRTLTNDYNGLKRQVRGFPLLLQEALKGVKAEVRARADATSTQGTLLKHQQRPPESSPLCHCHLQILSAETDLSGAGIRAFVLL